MRRYARGVAIIATIGGMTACGGSSASSGAADVVISPVALAQALATDRPAALASYGGKVLELTGTVGKKIEPGGLNPTMGVVFTGIDERLAFDANLSFVSFDAEDAAARSEFESLAVGDAVTLLCRLEVLNESGSLFLVKNCHVRD